MLSDTARASAFSFSELRFCIFLLPKRSPNATGTPHRQAIAMRQSQIKSMTAMIAVEIYAP